MRRHKHKRYSTQPPTSEEPPPSQQLVLTDLKCHLSAQRAQRSPLYVDKTGSNLPRLTSFINMPVQPLIEPPSISKPVECPPCRNNIRCLNDFLKQQAYVIKHKQKMIVNLPNKGNQADPLVKLKAKIVNMLYFRTNQSELMLKDNILESGYQNGSMFIEPFNSLQPIKSSLNKQRNVVHSSLEKRYKHNPMKQKKIISTTQDNRQILRFSKSSLKRFNNRVQQSELSNPEVQTKRPKKINRSQRCKLLKQRMLFSKVCIEFDDDKSIKQKSRQI